MNRRNFLGAILAAAFAPVVRAAESVTLTTCGPTVVHNEKYVSYVFRRTNPPQFDLRDYWGDGTTRELEFSLGWKPSLVIVRDTTEPDEWLVLRSCDVSERNKPGHRYIAYGFGEELMPQIQPILDEWYKDGQPS